MYLSRLILNPRTPPRPARAGRALRDAPLDHARFPGRAAGRGAGALPSG